MACIRAIRDILIEHGIPAHQADDICAAILDNIGGQRHYIARSDFAKRNREIADGFRGNNLSEVAERFGLSTRQVRRVLLKPLKK